MDLAPLFRDDRRIEIVDVGAADLDGGQIPPYNALIDAGVCRVTGFEPNPDEFTKLAQSAARRYLPNAIGDGRDTTLNITKAPGFSSVLAPNIDASAMISRFSRQMRVVQRVPVKTSRLDDMEEIEIIDFLKIDIQGGERMVFEGGRTKLSKAVVIQTEVAFFPLYHDQPNFGDQDRMLQSLGFQFFGMQTVNKFQMPGISDAHRKASRRADIGPWVDGDAVYVRKMKTWTALPSEDIRRMIVLLSRICSAWNAVAYLANILKGRGEFLPDQLQELLN
ncbi:MAG: FkbM family methyltransferase [Deltaproteobacteria bacterium]